MGYLPISHKHDSCCETADTEWIISSAISGSKTAADRTNITDAYMNCKWFFVLLLFFTVEDSVQNTHDLPLIFVPYIKYEIVKVRYCLYLVKFTPTTPKNNKIPNIRQLHILRWESFILTMSLIDSARLYRYFL